MGPQGRASCFECAMNHPRDARSAIGGFRQIAGIADSTILRRVVFAQESDLVLEVDHVGPAAPLCTVHGFLPELFQFVESKDLLIEILANANVPRVLLADVEAEPIRPDRDTETDITVSEKNSFG
jgi:hypothetical protein